MTEAAVEEQVEGWNGFGPLRKLESNREKGGKGTKCKNCGHPSFMHGSGFVGSRCKVGEARRLAAGACSCSGYYPVNKLYACGGK